MDDRLQNHPHFTRWCDPVSGTVSYLLTRRLGPLQKVWYFMEPCMRGESPILWFHVAHPPARQWTSAAVSLDPDQPQIRHFPHAVSAGNPMLTADGGTAWLPIADGIYEQPFDGEPREVFRLPRELLQGRQLHGLVTDLSLSTDNRRFLLDCHIGNRWLLATVDRLDASFTPLRWFGNRHYHAVFSRHDPDLFMVNLGHWTDPVTGDKFEMNNRIWIMDTALSCYQPLLPDAWFGRNSWNCHEWWTKEGNINVCDYQRGVIEADPHTHQSKVIWPRTCTHAQSDSSNRWFAGDVNCYRWNDKAPCSVWFFNRDSGRETAIVSKMPPQPLAWRDFRSYHIDPHPSFSEDGRYIAYTTTAPGYLTVALAPVDPLVQATS
jgi:hypothetical protein